jgi:hypothetical protein
MIKQHTSMSVTVRVSPRQQVAGAVLVAVLAAGGAAGVRTGWGGDDYRVDGPAPAELTVGGARLTLTGQQPVVDVVPMPGDSTRLLVTGTPAEFDACTHTAVRVVEQDDVTVRLAAYSYGPDGGTAPGACPIPVQVGPVTVDLGAPLEARRVLEAGTDHVLVVGTDGPED